MTTVRALVIENDSTDDPRRLGQWLTEAGLTLDLIRPHAGQPLPPSLDGYAALVVLGGGQHAYPDATGTPGAPWFPALESLLRKAVRARLPTLGVCLGGQLLAQAHAGRVGPAQAGPEIGPRLVAKRDAAYNDPLFGPVPMLADVLQWHHDEILELPAGATLLAASTYYPHQAFRLGDRAWGTQFHIECDLDLFASWVEDCRPLLAELEIDPAELVARTAAVIDDLEEAWQPFAARFAAAARGELADPTRELPLLGR